MIRTLTARRLKPGAFDAFREAFEKAGIEDVTQEIVKRWSRVYVCRDVGRSSEGATSAAFVLRAAGRSSLPRSRRQVRPSAPSCAQRTMSRSAGRDSMVWRRERLPAPRDASRSSSRPRTSSAWALAARTRMAVSHGERYARAVINV